MPKDNKQLLEDPGWLIIENQVNPELCDLMKKELSKAYAQVRPIQLESNPNYPKGIVHHLLPKHTCFFDFLNSAPAHPIIHAFFDGHYILNSFSGVLLENDSGSYLAQIHRDIRHSFYPHHLMLNMILLLDDFTQENGATWLMPHSQPLLTPPSEKNFFNSAQAILASKGSLVIFDSDLWHCAGKNRTNQYRGALTLTFSRPWMKPQFDYLSSYHTTELNEYMGQVLGANARVPQSDQDWYQPEHKRFFKKDQA